jgi:hypothetical protein
MVPLGLPSPVFGLLTNSIESVEKPAVPAPERLHVYALKRFDAQARR